MSTVYLIHATPYDPDASAEVDVRFSLGSKTPKFDGKHWPARLIQPPRYTVEIDDKDFFDAGAATPRGSTVDIAVGDGDNDALRRYYWEGRRITVYRGEEGQAFGSFTTLLNSVVERVEWTRAVFTIEIAGFNALLDQPVQQNVYAGTGGLEGGSNLKDKPKPRVFGKPRNIEPTLVSSDLGIFQVSDGALEAVDAVYNSGAALELKEDSITLDEYFRRRDFTRLEKAVSYGFCISRDGLNLYGVYVDATSGDYLLAQFVFRRPYDLSTLLYVPGSDFNLTDIKQDSGSSVFRAVAIGNDGASIYAYESAAAGVGAEDYVHEITMTRPYDLSSAVQASGDFLGLGARYGLSLSLVLKSDGTKALAYASSTVIEITLTTGWDITTASLTDTFAANAAIGISGAYRSMEVNADGTELYFLIQQSSAVSPDGGFARITLSSGWDLTGASYTSGDSAFYFDRDDNGIGGILFGAELDSDGKRIFISSSQISGGTILTEFEFPSAYGFLSPSKYVDFNQYSTDTANGYIFVNTQRDEGVVTADVQGEADGSVLVQSAPELIRYLIGQELTDPDDLDTASFTQAETDNNSPVSLYLDSTERPTVNDVIPRLAKSIGAIVRPNTDGKLGVKVLNLTEPAGIVTLTEDDIEQGSLRRRPPIRPAYRVALEYDIAWRALTDAEIRFETANGDVVEFVRQGSRTAADSDSSVLTSFLRARAYDYDTLLDESADASSEATRRLNLLKVRRDVYRFALKGRSFEFIPGQVIKVQHPDLRVSTAITCLVLAVSERGNGETTLEVWG